MKIEDYELVELLNANTLDFSAQEQNQRTTYSFYIKNENKLFACNLMQSKVISFMLAQPDWPTLQLLHKIKNITPPSDLPHNALYWFQTIEEARVFFEKLFKELSV